MSVARHDRDPGHDSLLYGVEYSLAGGANPMHCLGFDRVKSKSLPREADRKHKPVSSLEETEIQKMIDGDPDAPEATDRSMAAAQPFTKSFPAQAGNMQKIVGGRPRSATPKVSVSIRLDQDVVAKLKEADPGWQSRITKAFRHEILSWSIKSTDLDGRFTTGFSWTFTPALQLHLRPAHVIAWPAWQQGRKAAARESGFKPRMQL